MFIWPNLLSIIYILLMLKRTILYNHNSYYEFKTECMGFLDWIQVKRFCLQSRSVGWSPPLSSKLDTLPCIGHCHDITPNKPITLEVMSKQHLYCKIGLKLYCKWNYTRKMSLKFVKVKYNNVELKTLTGYLGERSDCRPCVPRGRVNDQHYFCLYL